MGFTCRRCVLRTSGGCAEGAWSSACGSRMDRHVHECKSNDRGSVKHAACLQLWQPGQKKGITAILVVLRSLMIHMESHLGV